MWIPQGHDAQTGFSYSNTHLPVMPGAAGRWYPALFVESSWDELFIFACPKIALARSRLWRAHRDRVRLWIVLLPPPPPVCLPLNCGGRPSIAEQVSPPPPPGTPPWISGHRPSDAEPPPPPPPDTPPWTSGHSRPFGAEPPPPPPPGTPPSYHHHSEPSTPLTQAPGLPIENGWEIVP